MNIPISEELSSLAEKYAIPTKVHQACISNCTPNSFLMIRHGFSEQNLQEKEVFSSRPDFKMDDAYQYENIFLGEEYLDSRLHGIGIYQSTSQSKHLEGIDFQIVFVSPLRRAIQTAIFIFSTHPQRASIRFLLVPQLGECLCSSGCFSPYTLTTYKDEMNELAKQFDISLDYSLIEELGQSWQVKILEDPCISARILEEYSETQTAQKYIEIVFNEMKIAKNYLIEDWQMLYKKSAAAKQIIKQISMNAEETTKKCGRFAIVSHGFLMKCMTSSGLDEDGNLIGGYVFKNAEIYPFEL